MADLVRSPRSRGGLRLTHHQHLVRGLGRSGTGWIARDDCWPRDTVTPTLNPITRSSRAGRAAAQASGTCDSTCHSPLPEPRARKCAHPTVSRNHNPLPPPSVPVYCLLSEGTLSPPVSWPKGPGRPALCLRGPRSLRTPSHPDSILLVVLLGWTMTLALC